MLVHVLTPRARQLTLLMRLPEFLDGPLLSHLCAINNDCEPEQILRDYLPPDTADAGGDDDELAQHVREACLLAAQSRPANGHDTFEFLEVEDVEIEPADLPFIRQRLLADPMPLLAA